MQVPRVLRLDGYGFTGQGEREEPSQNFLSVREYSENKGDAILCAGGRGGPGPYYREAMSNCQLQRVKGVQIGDVVLFRF